MQKYQHLMLTDIDHVGFGVRYADHFSSYTPPHWHKAVELLLFVKGRVTCIFENGSRHFTPGDLFIINSHQVHQTKCSRNAEFLVVHISPDPMLLYVPTFDQLSFRIADDPDDPEKASAYAQVKEHMQAILRLTQGPDTAAPLEREARLFALTALLVRYFSQSLAVEESTLRRSDMTRLEPVLEYVSLHYREEISLDAAADLMGLNKEYFCRLFKKNMGVSFLQYVYQVRATAVCRELEVTEDPIGEIGERNGFRDPKMLNQYFREIYGCTPSEKRKAFREVSLEEENESGEATDMTEKE